MASFIVKLYHYGLFVPNPLKYVQGSCRIIKDIQLEDMQVVELFDVIKRLVLNTPKRLHYCLPGISLTRGIREINSDEDMVEFVRVCFENCSKVDLCHVFND